MKKIKVRMDTSLYNGLERMAYYRKETPQTIVREVLKAASDDRLYYLGQKTYEPEPSHFSLPWEFQIRLDEYQMMILDTLCMVHGSNRSSMLRKLIKHYLQISNN